MELQVGVKVAIKNKSRKFLLVKRSPDKYPDVRGSWDIVGGRINPGSTLLENLKREVLEETGIILENGVKLVAAQDILRVEGKHIVRLTYLGKLQANAEVKLDDESTQYKWFSIRELQKMTDQDLDIYFKDLVDKKLIK